MNMIASWQYWDTDGLYSEFTKTFNHSLACCVTIAGATTMLTIAFTSMRLMYVSDEIDNLEQAKEDYKKATSEMETARDKYTELISKN